MKITPCWNSYIIQKYAILDSYKLSEVNSKCETIQDYIKKYWGILNQFEHFLDRFNDEKRKLCVCAEDENDLKLEISKNFADRVYKFEQDLVDKIEELTKELNYIVANLKKDDN